MQQPRSGVVPQATADELGFLVNGAHAAINASIDSALQPLGITAAQFMVFNGIAKGTQCTIGELCRSVRYDSGAMTRLLDRIEQKGLIRRVANPLDRRSYLLELTAKGEVLAPRARRRAQAVSDALLQRFSQREANALRALLHKIRETPHASREFPVSAISPGTSRQKQEGR